MIKINNVCVYEPNEIAKEFNKYFTDIGKLKDDPTIKKEVSLQGYLRKLKKLKCFEKDIYNKIYSVGSQPARIYALPKMHKLNLLSSCLPKHYTTFDSFSFVADLKQVDVTNKFIVSYDVESLFTNIPLNETINIATELFFKDETRSKYFSKTHFKKLLQISTSGSHFLFNGKFYDQLDGVAMGSPLAPILANVFIGFHEQTWVNNCLSSIPIFYKRYVDDIIAIFNSEFEAQEFFKHLNKQHKNLRFTKEKEKTTKFHFFDVLTNKSNSLSTSVYHKKTITGLLQIFFSFVPSCYKTGLLRCLIDRTYKINNTWFGFDKDIKNLSLVLKDNQFPQKVIDTEIKLYVEKKTNPPVINTGFIDKTNIRYFKLPFIGFYSNFTKTKIDKIIKKYCKNVLIKFIFITDKLKTVFA
ncbi:uncharacterized protein LOC136073930 [Hydra vulgaris]|uniref:uncharacterized protein LOC136073930 n=1 Tax=Hydra vulgaris TaxID=6087 RepID=UPI0032EA1F42